MAKPEVAEEYARLAAEPGVEARKSCSATGGNSFEEKHEKGERILTEAEKSCRMRSVGAKTKQGGMSGKRCRPVMTADYSRISDTAKAVTLEILPLIRQRLAGLMRLAGDGVFRIADYGAADGVNSGPLFAEIAPILSPLDLELFYIDLASSCGFDRFWREERPSGLAQARGQYWQRSFYLPFPELEGKVHLGFSSTAMHWLDTLRAEAGFFRHPEQLQPNQLPPEENRPFVEKWREDWRIFFRERARELVPGGFLFLACLAGLGGEDWPASAGYDYLRDICAELHREGGITPEEREAVFIPDYFACPEEITALLGEEEMKRLFKLHTCRPLTVPCAYYSRSRASLNRPSARAELAGNLARVVRAWSRSSLENCLEAAHPGLTEEIYRRLEEKFRLEPKPLPYQYCLLELERR